MSSKKYDASSIEVIENLEAVRKRPGMYIGDTNTRGLHHLFKEILDNSIDEHLAGHCKKIHVTLKPNNSIIVEDDGRGVPVDIHPKTKKPAVETIFTVLHAGGKFGGENSGYKMSGGLHGVGSSVVNALSESLKVTSWKDKFEYEISFKNGGQLDKPLTKLKATNKTGTKVEFRPDPKMFTTINFNAQTIVTRLKELSYLNKKLEITFEDLKNEESYEFKFPEGLVSYVEDLTSTQKQISKPYSFSAENDKIVLNVAFKYTTSDYEHIVSFVNNITTPGGGTHETAFKTALTKAVNEFIEVNKLQEQGKLLEGEDVREGITAVISLYIVEEYLQFEGQTKDKLSSNQAKPFLDKNIYEQLIHYLNTNRTDAALIIKKAYESKRAREAAKKAREITKELSKNAKKSFVGKLVTAQTNKKEDRELFIVEGDSAGGSAKLGRDRKTQAILPLKGKIINTEKASLKAIIANEELATIIHSIGSGIGDDFNLKDSEYGKIIIMTDADTDGAHIQTLLLTFFYRFMQPLVEKGMIYIALPPLYKVTNKSNKSSMKYLWSDEELLKEKEKSSNFEIQRYKGLGEMNSDQLWETTMDPDTRTLIQVDAKNFEDINKIIEILMGQDAEPRREWIEGNVEFSNEDTEKTFVKLKDFAKSKMTETELLKEADDE